MHRRDWYKRSLYPSAMYRLPGTLLGEPKVINILTKEFLKNPEINGYFVKIKILDVKINRKFPLMYKKVIRHKRVTDDNAPPLAASQPLGGQRKVKITKAEAKEWSNEMIGQYMYIDNIGLEDLEKFHKIDYEIIQGYYFDEGFNPKLSETMLYLFRKRAQLQKDKNPSQIVIKLLLNSAYGKTILKPITHDQKIINKKSEFDSYLRRNYNSISEITFLDGDIDSEYMKARIKSIKAIHKHFNIPHVGVQILSMSKRIMCEVICTSEDNGIEIYYQDTDSVHIEDADIEKLSQIFFEKYGRELIGKELGQFHSDFADPTGGKLTDIHAIYSIFIAKKCYYDALVGTHKETGELMHFSHYRMKGVNDAAIKEQAKVFGSVEAVYEHLYDGNAISFNLSASGTQFKHNKDFTISTNNSMVRKISFD